MHIDQWKAVKLSDFPQFKCLWYYLLVFQFLKYKHTQKLLRIFFFSFQSELCDCGLMQFNK